MPAGTKPAKPNLLITFELQDIVLREAIREAVLEGKFRNRSALIREALYRLLDVPKP